MELTQKQRNVLNFIANFTIENSYPPTYSEISSEFKISTTTVQEYIGALVKKGYLEKSSGVARGFVMRDKSVSEFTRTRKNVRLIPIIGTVNAGQPVLATENVEGYVAFDSSRFENEKLFALYVKGDSMKDVGILENDIVIAHPQNAADDNSIVIALLENNATIKRLKRDSEGYYLKPENDNYSNIRGNFSILGKVVGLKRQEIQ